MYGIPDIKYTQAGARLRQQPFSFYMQRSSPVGFCSIEKFRERQTQVSDEEILGLICRRRNVKASDGDILDSIHGFEFIGVQRDWKEEIHQGGKRGALPQDIACAVCACRREKLRTYFSPRFLAF